MILTPDEIRNFRSATSATAYIMGASRRGQSRPQHLRAAEPDAGKSPHGSGNAQASKSSPIISTDRVRVAAVLSISYDTAIRVMGRMKRTADFAKPRARKR